MKKAFFGLTALLIALLVSGCNQLTQYTISEQEVNQALQKHNNYEKDIGVSGQPVYEPQQGAIYLRDLEIVDTQVAPEKMASIMKTLTPYLNQSLKSYFDQNPAYVLSADRSKGESLAKKFAKGLEVKPGELVIPFTQ